LELIAIVSLQDLQVILIRDQKEDIPTLEEKLLLLDRLLLLEETIVDLLDLQIRQEDQDLVTVDRVHQIDQMDQLEVGLQTDLQIQDIVDLVLQTDQVDRLEAVHLDHQVDQVDQLEVVLQDLQVRNLAQVDLDQEEEENRKYKIQVRGG